MELLAWILGSTVLVSLFSLIGSISFVLNPKALQKMLLLFVALAAGGMLGGAFFHLIPEAYEEGFNYVGLGVISGFLMFFLIEKYLHWHHHGQGKGCKKDHSLAYMSLIGDAFHNFIDGMIIATAFFVDISFGIITSLIVIVHEIPQEIGDLGILLYCGFSKKKALFVNLLTGLTAVLGAFIAYIFASRIEFFSQILIPLAAGGFVYIAASDLIPEINKKSEQSKKTILFFLIGLALMYGLTFLEI